MYTKMVNFHNHLRLFNSHSSTALTADAATVKLLVREGWLQSGYISCQLAF